MEVVLSCLCMRFLSSQGKPVMRDDPKSRQDSAKTELAKFHKIAFRVPEVVTRLPQIAVVRRYLPAVYTQAKIIYCSAHRASECIVRELVKRLRI